MVKLRGINVWPEAVGEVATAVDGVAPDYFVRAVRADNRDEMIVSVVSDRDPSEHATLQAAVEHRIKDQLGVRMQRRGRRARRARRAGRASAPPPS